jgi:hypothetical protein
MVQIKVHSTMKPQKLQVTTLKWEWSISKQGHIANYDIVQVEPGTRHSSNLFSFCLSPRKNVRMSCCLGSYGALPMPPFCRSCTTVSASDETNGDTACLQDRSGARESYEPILECAWDRLLGCNLLVQAKC